MNNEIENLLEKLVSANITATLFFQALRPIDKTYKWTKKARCEQV